jgi:DNA gyrase/topoisomerase IV subunit A
MVLKTSTKKNFLYAMSDLKKLLLHRHIKKISSDCLGKFIGKIPPPMEIHRFYEAMVRMSQDFFLSFIRLV